MSRTALIHLAAVWFLGFSLSPFIFAGASDLSWARSSGGTGSEGSTGLATAPDGGVIQVGTFSGTVDFDPGAGVAQLTATGATGGFVQKLDADGDFVWAALLDGPTGPQVSDVAVDSAGNVYVVGRFSASVDFDPGPGTFTLNSNGISDAYLVKLDSSGAFVWALHWGGSGNEYCDAVTTAADGSIYAGGNFANTVDFDPGPGTTSRSPVGPIDGYVSKFAAHGTFQWVYQAGSFGVDLARDLAVDTAGGLFVLGDFQGAIDFDPGPGTTTLTSAGDSDVFVVKLTSLGALTWARKVGGFTTDLSTAIAVGDTGDVRFVGYFGGSGDFDPGPGTFNLASAGSADAFIVQLDSNGDFDWAHNLGGTGFDIALGTAVDSNGRVYVGGRFEDSVDFDPGPGTDTITATGNQPDAFVAEFDAAGDYQQTYVFKGSSYEDVINLRRATNDDLLVAGNFSGSPDFDPGPGFVFLGSQGSRDVFVLRLGNASIVLPDLEEIEISSNAARDAALAGTVYAFSVFVLGDANLADVTVTPPGQSPLPLTFDPFEGGFAFEDASFTSLAALRAAYPLGEYRFDFNGGATFVELEHLQSEPQCFADVQAPAGSCTSSLTPTFTWDLPVGCTAGAVDAGLEIAATESELFGLSFIPASSGSVVYPNGPVTPTPVDPLPPLLPLDEGESYRFGVDVVDGVFLIESLGADSFEFSSSFRADFDTAFVASANGPVLSTQINADTLSWSCSASVANSVDVVRGDLAALASGYATATTSCLADDLAASSLTIPQDPPSGSGWWYLIREVGAGGNSSYSSFGAAESAGRDAGIAASGNDCS